MTYMGHSFSNEYALYLCELHPFSPLLESEDAFITQVSFLLWLNQVLTLPGSQLDMVARLLIWNKNFIRSGSIAVPEQVNQVWKEILTTSHKQKNPALCTFVLKQINVDYSSLTLHELACRLGLNSSYLSRVISQDMQCSFLDLLHCRRILSAVEAFCTPRQERSLDDIAYQLGYSSLHYFYCVFKSYTGLTPAKARETVLLLNKM